MAIELPDLRDDLVFAGAFPTSWLSTLNKDDLEGFGASDYPQGHFR